jgi:hypothetical protein
MMPSSKNGKIFMQGSNANGLGEATQNLIIISNKHLKKLYSAVNDNGTIRQY